MILLILLTVLIYSVLLVGLLAKLNDKRAVQLVHFMKRQSESSHRDKQHAYEQSIGAR
ncbi:hypothetical protein ACFFGV_06385 [Pontibacillus salicampi]|uniref:Uncharacterized protein n=1 Tax=Pontibacillus salicampi TaxID=1449801 RepID=A0ABV6LLJ0_9BACI